MLLTGQRRMGKTSVARELGRRLADKDWMFLFSDVEGATCAEDAIAELAHAAHAVRPIATRFAEGMGRLFNDRVDEISALDFRVKFRAGLDAGSWKRHGERLLRDCAGQRHPVLLPTRAGATVSISFDSGTVSGCMLGVPFKGFEAVSLLVSLF